MNCPNCNSEVSENQKFCANCGAYINNVRYCANCGTQLPEGGRFCPECGTPADSAEATPAADRQAPYASSESYAAPQNDVYIQYE